MKKRGYWKYLNGQSHKNGNGKSSANGHGCKLTQNQAAAALGLMDDFAKPDKDNPHYSSLVITNAGIDRRKEDPSVAGMVILPDEIVVFARPLSDEDRRSMHYRPDIGSTQELELFAARTGLAKAAQEMKDGSDHYALIICDCLGAAGILEYFSSQSHPVAGMDIVGILHPTKDADLISPQQSLLHGAVHTLTQEARKENKIVELHLGREALMSMASSAALRR